MASAIDAPLRYTHHNTSSWRFLLPTHPTNQHLHLRRLTSSVAFTHNPKAYRRRPTSPKATQYNPPLPVPHHHHQTHVPANTTNVLHSFAGSTTRHLHARVLKLGLAPWKPMLSEKLAILCEKAPLQKSALKVLDGMTGRNLVALYASIVGILARLDSWVDLLHVFVLMMEESVHPDKFLLPKILKASAEMGDLGLAAALHGYIIKKMNLDIDVVLGNSLIDMYAICGDLESSKILLTKMPQRNVVSWTALVAGYSNNCMMDEAVGMFQSMEEDGIEPDVIAWNALISGYARKGNVSASLSYLEKMKERGKKPVVSTFNGLLSGFVQSGFFQDALDAFLQMLPEEAPNSITVASAISACSSLREPSLGQQLHAYALKCDFTSNAFVCGSAINMYFNCDVGKSAEKVFVKTENKNSAIWNALIAGYADAGRMEEALELMNSMERDGSRPDVITYNTVLASFARGGRKEEAFNTLNEMLDVGLKPNTVTMNGLIGGFQQCGLSKEALKLFRILQSPYCISSDDTHQIDYLPVELLNEVYLPNATTLVSALAACADLKSKGAGEEIHAYALRNHFDCNIFVSSALVDMYTKCNDIDLAAKVFYAMDEKNPVSWNSLIAGYNLKGMPEVALSLFKDMLEGGTDPNFITLLVVISACSSARALNLGRGLHGFAVKSQGNIPATLQSSLVGMYAKCSSLPEARLVFDCALKKELGLWNAIISSYALHGLAKDSILLFEKMMESGIEPNHITFTAIISACNREGLAAEGWNYFHLMKGVHGITPTLEHFTCIVGVLGLADSLEEAANFVRRMAFESDAFLWGSLLRSSDLDMNNEIGEMDARELSELKSWNAFVCYYITFIPWFACGMLLRVLETHFNI